MDEQWYALERCLPCAVKFDDIVRLETFNGDASKVVQHLEGRGVDTHVNKKYSEQENNLISYQKKNIELVSDEQLEKFMLQYKRDFMMFGYGFHKENGLLKTECSIKINSTSSCC